MLRSRYYERYRELQAYVNWSEEDERQIRFVGSQLQPYLQALIEDFYLEIQRHSATREVITGGDAQIARLKGSLLRWITELLSGNYDEQYIDGRWRVGIRHVEIGLEQVYTNAALSRLRTGLIMALNESWTGSPENLRLATLAITKLIDLDLAIIEDAYQSEYVSRLQRTERLATMGQVAGGVAHELRNPLNVIKTSVYYLLHAKEPTPEKRVEHLRRIERHVDLADGVITALMSFSRLPSPNLLPVDLAQCVQQALELSALGKHILVDVAIPEDLPMVLGDLDQLRIVFGNLIRNASDALPNGGRLSIKAKHLGKSVEVLVNDTGIGIPPELLTKIMEPLYSTKARGMGLGLAISLAILENIHGKLSVESQLGCGTTFSVTLKAATKLQKEP